MKPLIGLTPIVDAGRDSLWMLPGYMQGLEAVGGIGMMLPLTDDQPLNIPAAFLCIGVWAAASAVLANVALVRRK